MPLSQIVSASIEDGAVAPVDLSSVAQYYGFKNRIINGAMVIDQRNAGAAVTVITGSPNFSVDRWYGTGEPTDGVYTLRQNAGSITPPTGFTNYLGATVTTADASIGATQLYRIEQRIEGFNVADLGWGTANAHTVTLSFWVRSSLTGTMGGAIFNADGSRSYPFTYTISSANTWEQKSITIVGDTSGTWLTTNGIGLFISLSLGAGSSRLGTAGAWASSFLVGATGQTQIIGTNGATFYITGVQLEKGVTATSFDYRPYGTELSLCQRYFSILTDVYVRAYQAAGQALANTLTLPVTMRTVPTLTKVGTWTVQNTGQPGISSANGSSSCYISFSATATADTYVLTPSTSTYVTAAAEL
jgi:hypothetical protein